MTSIPTALGEQVELEHLVAVEATDRVLRIAAREAVRGRQGRMLADALELVAPLAAEPRYARIVQAVARATIVFLRDPADVDFRTVKEAIGDASNEIAARMATDVKDQRLSDEIAAIAKLRVRACIEAY